MIFSILLLSDTEDELLGNDNDGVQANEEDVDVEEEEEFQILKADAVANPRTVMVHAHDTSSTLAAVVCSRRLDSFANSAFFEELVTDNFKLVSV